MIITVRVNSFYFEKEVNIREKLLRKIKRLVACSVFKNTAMEI